MAATETPQTDSTPDPARPLPRRAWWHRHLEPEERRRILNDLAIVNIEHWVYRFGVMLTLSVIVAVMGLSLNSAAVVIGAMLLAPLMQPVLAAGACLSMALFSKSLVAMVKVTAATTWCIAIAYAISWILPAAELTTEVLARTQPDIKDLVVALAAGTAGAYATVRSDVSSSLPGVAVAVALVPPLGAVGIALEQGETRLAYGALLLYITNLTAIIFASIVVFVITGFVPHRRLSQNLLRLTVATVAITAVVILVAVPLYRTSVTTINRNTQQQTVDDIVAGWLGAESRLTRTIEIDREDQTILVELEGFLPPPDQGDLEERLLPEYPEYSVLVQWFRTEQATTTTLPPPEPTEQLLAQIRVEVDAWLSSGDIEYQIDDISLEGSRVRIDAAGTGEPPSISELVPRLTALDETLEPGLTWATLATFTETTLPSQTELALLDMQGIVDEWAEQRGLVVRGVAYDGQRVEVDVLGPVEPDIARLELELQAVADNEIPVAVYFTQRLQVTTTIPLEIPIETQ